MQSLQAMADVPPLRAGMRRIWAAETNHAPREVMGLTFRNPVGLAAGFDKDARYIRECALLGFGFVEIGTVTPRPQPGNPKPRLFRLPADHALINRMGFNNDGAEEAARRLARTPRPSGFVVGGNIGKNKDTPNEHAVKDYTTCLRILHEHVDYFVVNVSSPNTPGLRDLQEKQPLRTLLLELQDHNARWGRPKPLLLKISPDLNPTQLDDIVEIAGQARLAGLVATNTTISRSGLTTPAPEVDQIGAGGLSGPPLRDRAASVLQYLHLHRPAHCALIGVGGIDSQETARARVKDGADLIQIYTGFVYEGPRLIREIRKAWPA